MWRLSISPAFPSSDLTFRLGSVSFKSLKSVPRSPRYGFFIKICFFLFETKIEPACCFENYEMTLGLCSDKDSFLPEPLWTRMFGPSCLALWLSFNIVVASWSNPTASALLYLYSFYGLHDLFSICFFEYAFWGVHWLWLISGIVYDSVDCTLLLRYVDLLIAFYWFLFWALWPICLLWPPVGKSVDWYSENWESESQDCCEMYLYWISLSLWAIFWVWLPYSLMLMLGVAIWD